MKLLVLSYCCASIACAEFENIQIKELEKFYDGESYRGVFTSMPSFDGGYEKNLYNEVDALLNKNNLELEKELRAYLRLKLRYGLYVDYLQAVSHLAVRGHGESVWKLSASFLNEDANSYNNYCVLYGNYLVESYARIHGGLREKIFIDNFVEKMKKIPIKTPDKAQKIDIFALYRVIRKFEPLNSNDLDNTQP